MTIQLILILILGILLFFLFLKITKAVMKAAIITLLIFLLLFGIVGFMIFKDIKEGKSLSENKFIQFFKAKLISFTSKGQDSEEIKQTTQLKVKKIPSDLFFLKSFKIRS